MTFELVPASCLKREMNMCVYVIGTNLVEGKNEDGFSDINQYVVPIPSTELHCHGVDGDFVNLERNTCTATYEGLSIHFANILTNVLMLPFL